MQKQTFKIDDFKFLNIIRKIAGLIMILIILFYPKKERRSIFIPITFLGLLIRFLAAGTIHKNKMLARDGIYSITRNPLYLGSFLIGLGLSLVFLPLILVLGYIILFFSIYLPKMKQEERDLKRLFPTIFPEYQKNIPLFFPSFKHYKKGGFSFEQSIKNKEYNLLLAVILILIKEYGLYI